MNRLALFGAALLLCGCHADEKECLPEPKKDGSAQEVTEARLLNRFQTEDRAQDAIIARIRKRNSSGDDAPEQPGHN